MVKKWVYLNAEEVRIKRLSDKEVTVHLLIEPALIGQLQIMGEEFKDG